MALSALFIVKYPDTGQLLAIVAFYLLLKRLFTTGISMLSGLLTLKIPTVSLFNGSIILCFVGTLLIAFGHVVAGVLLAFLFNTIVVTFSPLIAIQQQSGKQLSLQAISSTSTWWDLGAALGAFSGIFLVETMGVQLLLFLLASFIFILFLNYIFGTVRFRNGN